jgi:hypothetical protein
MCIVWSTSPLPKVTLRHCDDLSAANWLSKTDVSPERLITFGPAKFPAYARLRYLPDPVRPGMAEADVQLPVGHAPDIDVARTALRALARYSSSTDSCYVCVWYGYGLFRDPDLIRRPMVTIPHRKYVLFTGTVSDLDNWNDLFEAEFNSPPSFVWPADHRWCFASDVDPHWAGVGADTGVINQLIADTSLDVVAADPNEKQPTYY